MATFYAIIAPLLLVAIIAGIVVLIVVLAQHNRKTPPVYIPQPPQNNPQNRQFPYAARPDEAGLVAVISAAIAAFTGESAKDFRVTKVTEAKRGANSWYNAGRNDIINSRL